MKYILISIFLLFSINLGYAEGNNPLSGGKIVELIALAIDRYDSVIQPLIANLQNEIVDLQGEVAEVKDEVTDLKDELNTYYPTLSIGDYYQQGIVCYLEGNRRHGLVIALEDAAADVRYSKNDSEFGAANGIYGGLLNSVGQLGRASSSTTPDAITRVMSYYANNGTNCDVNDGQDVPPPSGETCFGNWYIATVYEWQVCMSNYDTVQNGITSNGGSEVSGRYWSSTIKNSKDNGSSDIYTISFNSDGSSNIDTSDVNGGNQNLRGIHQF